MRSRETNTDLHMWHWFFLTSAPIANISAFTAQINPIPETRSHDHSITQEKYINPHNMQSLSLILNNS